MKKGSNPKTSRPIKKDGKMYNDLKKAAIHYEFIKPTKKKRKSKSKEKKETKKNKK